MPQNSASPKCESRNPHQTFCEFRKFAAGRGKRNKTATTAKNPAPTRGRGNRINYLCIEFNPFAQPKTTSKPN
jgi:hypothetical protein